MKHIVRTFVPTAVEDIHDSDLLEVPTGVATFSSLTGRYEYALRMAAQGCNHFVGYLDSNDPERPFGLTYARNQTVAQGHVWAKDLHALVH